MMNEHRMKALIHWAMSIVGGYIGAYALINKSEIFPSAMTSNMIYSVFYVLDWDLLDLAYRFMLLISYISGIAFVTIYQKRSKFNIHIFSIIIDAVMIVAVEFLPDGLNNFIFLYPVSFAMAIQWVTFKGVDKFDSATIFSTNNLRQAATAATEYFILKEQEKKDKLKFYLGTLFSFHLGVAALYIDSCILGYQSLWFCMLPLLAAVLLEWKLKPQKLLTNPSTIP
jgi:uncharacterized membrane protein YoaK (UPF0700 family)